MTNDRRSASDLATVLLVEAPDREPRKLADAFESAAGTVTVRTRTAERALSALSRRDSEIRDGGGDKDESTPTTERIDIVIVNLPPADRTAFLEAIESDPEAAPRPVLVLLDPTDEELWRCYARGANACLDRTTDPNSLASAVAAFWLRQVELPRRS